jgi:Zn-dependent protease/CBS domain-containing protein
MPGSLKIGTLFGIPIRVNYTFLLVLPLLALMFGRNFTAITELAGVPERAIWGSPLLWGLGIAVALFASVLAHELGHALYAIHKGGKVLDIVLLPIGGVSQISEPPRENKHEAVMALAGPLVSLAIGVGLLAVFALMRGLGLYSLQLAVFYVAQLNLMLGFFNLLPAFPMDGGRILRSLLATRMGPVRSTQVAAAVGKGFALFFALVGILTFNLFLLLIAFFVYAGAQAEGQQVLMKAALGEVQVQHLMSGSRTAVGGDMPLSVAVDQMISEKRTTLPVTEDGLVRGMLTLADVQHVAASERATRLTRQVARIVTPVHPTDDVWTAFRQMREQGFTEIAVVTDGQLIGTISQDDVARGLQLLELRATESPRYAR